MGRSFPTTRRMANMIMWLFTLITIFSFCRIVSSQLDKVQKLVGESITLTCEPSYVPYFYSIVWYREGRQMFVSDDDERFSVACKGFYYIDRCSLTVSTLTTDDSDTYVCNYHDGQKYNQIVGIDLTVTYGQLPSDDSPVCEIYEAAIDGGYISSNTSEVFEIGDEIFLRCTVLESDIKPSLSWIREQENNITKLTQNVTERTLLQPVNLTKMDEGALFSCYMNHPAFSETRNCSFIPLPASPPPTTTQTSTTVIIGIIIILITVATIAIVLAIVLKKRRKKNGMIPSKPNRELTYEGDQSISAENTPGSINLSHDLKDAKTGAKKYKQGTSLITTDPSLPETTTAALPTEKEDPSLLYATPDKRNKPNGNTINESTEYENVSCHVTMVTSNVPEENESDVGLMYADLELDDVPNSNPQRKSVISENATVYADIKES